MPVFVFLFLLYYHPCLTEGKKASSSIYESLVDAVLEFALASYKDIASHRGFQENIVFSPFSVFSVVLMVHLGSRKQTSRQISQGLKLCRSNIPSVHEAYGQLLKELTSDLSFKETLAAANGIFLQKNLRITRFYEHMLRYYYNSTVQRVDFKHNATGAQLHVNKWVSANTGGRIENALFKTPSEMTLMILVNALHFRGEWMWQFDPDLTEPSGRFYVTPNLHVSVPMMVGKMNITYGHFDQFQASVAEMPFKDGRISMFFILPDQLDGLDRLQRQLNLTTVKYFIKNMRKTEINIRIPRFTVDQSPVVGEVLWNLGIRDIFSPNDADFTGITSDEHLYVSRLVHRALVQVDERGGQATAVTMMMVERIGSYTGTFFEANHPFVFLIIDKKSGLVLFMGRLAGF